jgi:alkylhydroperoxidase family enzyme
VQNIQDYTTNPLFTEAERAALYLAEKANSPIDEVTDEDFARLRQHFDPRQIVQIVGLIALMSFYNKWNATMATALETPWLELAASNMTKG